MPQEKPPSDDEGNRKTPEIATDCGPYYQFNINERSFKLCINLVLNTVAQVKSCNDR